MQARKRFPSYSIAALLLGGLTAHDVGAAAEGAAAPVASSVREARISFADLDSGPIELHGVQSVAGLNIGTRKDEMVVGAKLHLRLTYSPSMLPDLSHLRVSLNGQALAAIALPKEAAGREIEREIELDPRYFSDYNQIRFDLIGHYSLDCEDPQHSSLWATISQQSDLTLTLRPIELRDDLALLPAPFFDQRDNRRLTLAIVLPANASRNMIRSAGLAASWFGMLADYRSARFPVSFDAPPAQHALVFATNESRPTQLALPAVQMPTVSVIDHLANRLIKMLVFQGKDEAQLQQAVEGLVLGSAVLTGTSASIAHVSYRRRPAYDAPRWLRTDSAVKLGELLDRPDQLQASGLAPAPMRVILRLPPDLFTWNRSGVPIDLQYRYTAPHEPDNSLLSITFNDQLLRSYRLEPQSRGDGRLAVPLPRSGASRESQSLLIPPFQLASNNRLQFQFAMEYHRQGLCKEVFVDNTREAIDPDSTIDISSFPHYAAMPNLSLFANAGYPFTRYADLAETAIVLPDAADRAALEQLFFVLGRMGRQTGVAAVGYQLLDAQQAERAKNVDLLLLSGAQSNNLLSHWGRDLPLVFDAADRRYHELDAASNSVLDRPRADSAAKRQAADVVVRANGSLGAFMSFESPNSARRTVVALIASDRDAADSLVASLEDESKVPSIRGNLAIVRGGSVQSYQGESVYYVGSLSPWQWLTFHVSRHPLLLTLISLATAITVALLIYGWLRRRVARRLAIRSET
jgi:cellulose synthase operon protein B